MCLESFLILLQSLILIPEDFFEYQGSNVLPCANKTPYMLKIGSVYKLHPLHWSQGMIVIPGGIVI